VSDQGVDTNNGSLLSVLGKVSVSIDTLSSRLHKQQQMQALAERAEQPRYITFHSSVIIPASGLICISFDQRGPDQGHYWQVKKIVIGGLTTTTVAAGRADMFVSAADMRNVTTLAQIGIADWEDQAAALPFINHYGDDEFVMRHNEELYVVLSGCTAGQQYVVRGRAVDYEEAANKQAWSL